MSDERASRDFLMPRPAGVSFLICCAMPAPIRGQRFLPRRRLAAARSREVLHGKQNSASFIASRDKSVRAPKQHFPGFSVK